MRRRHLSLSISCAAVLASLLGCGTGMVEGGKDVELTAVETPIFLPPAGEHMGPLEVSIQASTSGATIYYTIGASPEEPTESSAVYTGPLTISATTTIAAKAFKAGMSPSETASATYTISTVSGVPAFPGAEGGGAESVGGRGGRVIHVTNLDTEGPGSLREAMESSGPRIVVFDVGGIIHLQRTSANPDGFIYVTNPYLTVAGQTAPGGGITVHGQLFLQAPNVIIRFITIRLGDATNNNYLLSTGMNIGGGAATNVMIDHVSLSWAHDDSFQVWGARHVEKYSISWNLIAEGLRDPRYHSSQGMMFGNDNDPNSTNIAVHHNVLMKFTDRMPQTNIKEVTITNNIIYNRAWEFTMIFGGAKADIIGNIYKDQAPVNQKEVHCFGSGGSGAYVPGDPSIFIQGNIGPNQPDPDGDNWLMVSAPVSRRRTTPLPPALYPITIHSTDVLESTILEDVGNSRGLDENGNWVNRRDSVDARLINEYKTGTGILPEQTSNSEPWDAAEVGGWPVIDPGTPYADTDRDGMPNAWELEQGLDPNDSGDASGDSDSDGYTNIEEFLNGKTS